MRVIVDTIESREDHERALQELSELMDLVEAPEVLATVEARFDVLTALIEAYEREHHPIFPPHPIDAIKFYLDQRGEDESVLVGLIGSRSRVREVLQGRRPLSLDMIRRLHFELGIPADSLIGA